MLMLEVGHYGLGLKLGVRNTILSVNKQLGGKATRKIPSAKVTGHRLWHRNA